MPERYRATFFNSLSGFKSLNLIGTMNQQGITNLGVFNSIVHLGANPPLLGMVFRPSDSVRRHTLENILESGSYTLNHITASMLPQAHHASAKYAEDESEFEACGFKPLWSEYGTAPYVAESSIKMMMQYRMHFPIELNNTIFLIGEIQEIILPENCIASDGFVDMEKAGTLTVAGLDAYYATELLARYTYARPGQQSSILAADIETRILAEQAILEGI
jgi:flavin reductase (DIM6/NTAB) family NADH-FMN oxidoreductase RutF